ncbi:hypothetical protein QCN29_27820 [Streptomyces sp. HNM0663]|uniref:Integral membrane protein n=1 Tax=Streptomyces chengmaiensis TaxID=3040919 RepID=A0ABT6HUX2_9ACTN|nr:hypothetical protein [Streptomyces chengmaiensis]MDH2392518.1 hypothetical protein [Streptomyces chengmaiensis]
MLIQPAAAPAGETAAGKSGSADAPTGAPPTGAPHTADIARLPGPRLPPRGLLPSRLAAARLPLSVTAASVPLYALWAGWLATGAGDLAAQVAWSSFAEHHPGGAYNLSWYGGMHPANYSLLTPHLMALVGVRAVSVCAGLAATWALTCLIRRVPRLTAPLWPSLLGAVTVWCNVASGRTTFAVGLAAACWACLLLRRPLPCAAAAALTAASSPVAGLFLLVVGAAQLLLRRPRAAASLLLPVALVQLCVALAFPYWGEQPMDLRTAALPLLLCAATAHAVPRSWTAVRTGAALYAAGVVLALLLTTPVGSNVDRLALVAGPPLLLAALLTAPDPDVGAAPAPTLRTASDLHRGRDRGAGPGPRPARRTARTAVVLAAVLAASAWTLGRCADDLRHSVHVPAWAGHAEEVTEQLRRLGADRSRIEVVPARDHREAWLFARRFQLARGWNRQLDVERARLFYDGTLDARTYRAWLDRWAVSHVVLHTGRPDGPAVAEAVLIASRPPWLRQVWQDDHWTVFAVDGATPLADGPGRIVRAAPAEVVLTVDRPGPVTVRVRHSPWLRADNGAAVRADGEWTRLTAPRAGRYRLYAPYLGL